MILFTLLFWRNSKDLHTFCCPNQYLCQGKRLEMLFFQKIESQNLKSGRTLGDRRCHLTLCHCPRFQSCGRAGTTSHMQQTRLPVLFASLSAALTEGGGLKGYPETKGFMPRIPTLSFSTILFIFDPGDALNQELTSSTLHAI